MTKLPSKAKVAIIRLRSLGDCVLSTPAIHLLKQWRSDLQIAVVVEDRFSAVYENNPEIDQILAPSSSEILRFHPHLVINLHGGTRSIALTAASLAPLRAGFEHYRAASIYNIQIPRAQEILQVERKVHTAEHVASAMFHLGVPVTEIPRARLFTEKMHRPRAYAVIHPFASAPEKQWNGFPQLLKSLRLEPVVIGTPSDDFSPYGQWNCETPSLEKTKSILAGASLFIGNDSGPAHMAAAFGIPSVVLFGPSDEVVWAPWRTEAQVIKSPDLSQINADTVLEAVNRLGVRA